MRNSPPPTPISPAAAPSTRPPAKLMESTRRPDSGGAGAASATVVAADGSATDSLDPFPADERHHQEGGHGFGPPPSQGRVEQQASEQNRREVGADLGLPRFGGKRCAREPRGDPALGPGQDRHHNQ